MEISPPPTLIAEQLSHTIDLIRFEMQSIKTEQAHIRELANHRLSELEECVKDHEDRLRVINNDVTRNKTMQNLASGGATFMSLVALLRSFFGM